MQRPIASIAAPLTDLLRHRQLLWLLTARDLRVRYRQSALGLAWAVLNPVLLMVVFTLVFARAIRPAFIHDLHVPYALFALTGLAPWNFFAAGITQSANSLVANRNLVTKVALPREVFPFTAIVTSLFDMMIAMLVLLGVALGFAMWGDWAGSVSWSVMWLVPLTAILTCFTAGVGLLAALANLFYRDVRQVLTVVLQLGMFLSGVVVPLPGGRWDDLLAWNPVALTLMAMRDCLLLGKSPQASTVAYGALAAVIVLVLSWGVFRRLAHRFAEVI